MASPNSPALTQQYRIKTDDAFDGATCFLRPSQALGFDLPDEIPAYAAGRECRPVSVPLSSVKAFEAV